jgi:hypothetical protein
VGFVFENGTSPWKDSQPDQKQILSKLEGQKFKVIQRWFKQFTCYKEANHTK